MAIEVRGVCTLILVFDMPAAPDLLRVDVQAPRVAHYGMKQLYVRDPDGYDLCFQWERKGGTR